MQVQNISNQQPNQNFQGGVSIVGQLSALPCKNVIEIAPKLKSLLFDKPFDLFIRENYTDETISFIVQKAKHFGKKNKPIAEYRIDKTPRYNKAAKNDDEMYYTIAKMAVDDYEKFKLPKSFFDKCKINLKKFIYGFRDAILDK